MNLSIDDTFSRRPTCAEKTEIACGLIIQIASAVFAYVALTLEFSVAIIGITACYDNTPATLQTANDASWVLVEWILPLTAACAITNALAAKALGLQQTAATNALTLATHISVGIINPISGAILSNMPCSSQPNAADFQDYLIKSMALPLGLSLIPIGLIIRQYKNRQPSRLLI